MSDDEFVVEDGEEREMALVDQTSAAAQSPTSAQPPVAKRKAQARSLIYTIDGPSKGKCVARVILSDLKLVDQVMASFPGVITSNQHAVIVTFNRVSDHSNDETRGEMVVRTYGPNFPHAIARLSVNFADKSFPSRDLPPSIYLNGMQFVTMLRSYVSDAVNMGLEHTIVVITQSVVRFMHPPKQPTGTTSSAESGDAQCMPIASVSHNTPPPEIVVPMMELPCHVDTDSHNLCLLPPPLYMDREVDLDQYFPVGALSSDFLRTTKRWEKSLKVLTGGDAGDGKKSNGSKSVLVVLRVDHVLSDQQESSSSMEAASTNVDSADLGDANCEERFLLMLMSGNGGQTGNQEAFVQTMSFTKRNNMERWKSVRECFMHDMQHNLLTTDEAQTSGPSDIHCASVNFSKLYSVLKPITDVSSMRLFLPRGPNDAHVRLRIRPVARVESNVDVGVDTPIDDKTYVADIFFAANVVDHEAAATSLDQCTRDTYESMAMCPIVEFSHQAGKLVASTENDAARVSFVPQDD